MATLCPDASWTGEVAPGETPTPTAGGAVPPFPCGFSLALPVSGWLAGPEVQVSLPASLPRLAWHWQGKTPGISIRHPHRGQSGGGGEGGGARSKAELCGGGASCSLPPFCRVSAALVSCILDAAAASRQVSMQQAQGSRRGGGEMPSSQFGNSPWCSLDYGR